MHGFGCKRAKKVRAAGKSARFVERVFRDWCNLKSVVQLFFSARPAAANCRPCEPMSLPSPPLQFFIGDLRGYYGKDLSSFFCFSLSFFLYFSLCFVFLL